MKSVRYQYDIGVSKPSGIRKVCWYQRYLYNFWYQSDVANIGIGIGMNLRLGIGIWYRYRYEFWVSVTGICISIDLGHLYQQGSSAGYRYRLNTIDTGNLIHLSGIEIYCSSPPEYQIILNSRKDVIRSNFTGICFKA